MGNIYEKYKRLFYLQNFFDIFGLIQPQNYKTSDIASYYKRSHQLFYRTFASKHGFMHVGLSENEIYKKDSGYELYQLNIIKNTIQKTNVSTAMEIGCGQCINLKYLASWCPQTHFLGFDLAPNMRSIHGVKNVDVYIDDYHSQSVVKDRTVDLVYAIETICYSDQKDKLLSVINQKLNPQGLVLIFDIFLGKSPESLSDIDRIYLNILENSYCLSKIELFSDFEKKIINSGFEICEAQNLSILAMPYLSEIESRMLRYLRVGGLFLKLLLKLYPKAVTRSMPPGILMKQMVEDEYLQYRYYLLKKSEMIK